MELRHLRYFVAVAEEENVTHAAARLHVSQPPLSRQIRNLEEELDVALFEHGAKSLRLTEAGRAFLGEARAVLQRVDAAVKLVKAVASGEQGEIHVGYAPSLTVELLPMALRKFEASNPAVKVRLHDLSTQEMLHALSAGELDAALLVQVSGPAPEGIVFETLRHHAVYVALPLASPLANEKGVALAQLLDERLVGFTLADYPEYHAWIADMFSDFPQAPKIVEQHDSVTSLIAAVEAGKGLTIVADGFERLSGARLSIQPVIPAPQPLEVGIAYRSGELMPAAENFIAAARNLGE